ncbi:unnamed protein product, partial [Ceratitis capitata]
THGFGSNQLTENKATKVRQPNQSNPDTYKTKTSRHYNANCGRPLTQWNSQKYLEASQQGGAAIELEFE